MEISDWIKLNKNQERILLYGSANIIGSLATLPVKEYRLHPSGIAIYAVGELLYAIAKRGPAKIPEQNALYHAIFQFFGNMLLGENYLISSIDSVLAFVVSLDEIIKLIDAK